MSAVSCNKRNNTYCCVPQCNSHGTRHPTLSFHLFPSDLKRRFLWILALRIGRRVSSRMCVCSKHFKKTDYFWPNLPAVKRRLKRTAIPSVNIPVFPTNTMEKIKEQKKNRKPQPRRGQQDEMTEILLKETSDDITENVEIENISTCSLEENECSEMICSEVSSEYSCIGNTDNPCIENDDLKVEKCKIAEIKIDDVTSECNSPENLNNLCKNSKLQIQNNISEAIASESSLACGEKENTGIVYLHKIEAKHIVSNIVSAEILKNSNDWDDKYLENELSLEDFQIEHMEDPMLAKKFFRLYHENRVELEKSKQILQKRTQRLEKTARDLEKLLKLMS